MAIRKGPNDVNYGGVSGSIYDGDFNVSLNTAEGMVAESTAKIHKEAEVDPALDGKIDGGKTNVRGHSKDWKKENERRGLNVDLFKYNFDSGARGNRFNVNFMCPPLNINLQGLRCTNATLPGRQIETGDFSTYGPTEKRPFNVTQDGQEVSFTFVCDSTFADRFIIEAWQGAIYSGHVISNMAEVPDGDVTNVPGNSAHPMFNYLYGAGNHPRGQDGTGDGGYAGIVEIQQYTRSDKVSLTYELLDAFPISYAPMQLASDSGDSLMTFEVTFAFRTFRTKYSQPANSNALNRGSRWLDAMLDIKNLRNGGNKSSDTLQRFNDRLKSFSGLFG